MSGHALVYKAPGPIAAQFLKHRPASLGDTLPIDCLIGPIGSGKSVACAIRIFLHACQQPKSKDGWRRSRWAVVRNTFDELKRTTARTWLDWFPEAAFGRFLWSPPFQHVIRLPDVQVELELFFVPMDNAAAVKKVLSWELTGAWVNECRETPREIAVALRSRCGRYPSLRDLEDPTQPGWAGVIMDTNAPEDELHYLCMWAGWTPPPSWMDNATRALMVKPAEVSIFVQPPGLIVKRGPKGEITGFKANPKAENLQWLRPGYYEAQLPGNTTSWILNMCCVEVRKAADSRLIYPDWNRDIHRSVLPLVWDATRRDLLIGMDFARNPAVVVAQEIDGQLRILREFIGQNIDVASFVRDHVMPEINTLYPDAAIRGWGDPSGNARTGGDNSTAFIHAAEGGLRIVKGWTNDPTERQAAVTRRLQRITGGHPAFLVDPSCTTLIGGFDGGYRTERKKVEGTLDTYHDDPVKNLFSHVADAAQYLVSGLDRSARRDQRQQLEAARAMGPTPNGRTNFDPLAIARAARGR